MCGQGSARCSLRSDAKRRAASSGSGPVSTASSSLVAAFGFFLFGLGLFFGRAAAARSILVGILRLRDDVGRVRIDEADDDVDQAAPDRSSPARTPSAGSRRSTGSWTARGARRPGLPRCAWRCGFRLRASAAPPCPSRACTCAPGRWCGRVRRRARPARRRLLRWLLRRRARTARARAVLSLSGAFSYTGMPMSLIMLTMSSICSGSTISRRQVIVHLRVGQKALFLAARDQQLELRLALFGQHVAARRHVDQFGVALLALLAIGRRGARRRAAARAAASFCAALSSTTLPLVSATGAAALFGGLGLAPAASSPRRVSAAAFAAMRGFALVLDEWSFEEWAAAAGLPAFLASFLEAGAAGRLCF